MKLGLDGSKLRSFDNGDTVATLYVVLKPKGDFAVIDPSGRGEGWEDFEGEATVFALRETAQSIAQDLGGEVISLRVAMPKEKR